MNTRSFLPALLALLTAVLPLRAQTITTTTLDVGSGGLVGLYTSQALVNGNPAIAYYDNSVGDLIYVRALDATGTSWGTPVVVDTGGGALAGQYLSLAVVNGRPAISYQYGGGNDLYYVRALDADGASWGTPVAVDTGGANTVGQYTSLAVIGGNPAIAYYDVTAADLKFVRATNADGTAWGSPVIVDGTTTSVGQYTSLAIINGNPAISYYDATNGDLKFARNDNADGSGAWTLTTVDTGGTNVVGQHTSLTVVLGNAAISYHDVTSGDLKYARSLTLNGNGAWAVNTVDTGGANNVGLYSSLRFNVPDDRPIISYYDNTSGDLKFARGSLPDGAGTWTTITLETLNFPGQYTSLLLVSGNPAISYYEAGLANLKYVRATNTSGTLASDWGAPITVAADTAVPVTGSYTSQAIVNGHPAIAYFDSTNGRLKYVRAVDAAGAAWGVPVNADSVSGVGLYASLAVVAGNPAIAYYDYISGNLKYVRASNASGTAWGTAIILDSPGLVGSYCSLAVVNGNPAISYHDSTNGDLKYIRANTTSGTLLADWAAPVVVDAPAGLVVGTYSSLAVVNGNPAISYHDQINADLKYVRASDANGAVWGAPIALDSAAIGGSHTSLAVVDGRPAISYHHHFGSDLRYIRATDADGATWGAPITLDSAGTVGQYTSLKVIAGHPAISYYDVTNGDLKYLRAKTPGGTLAADWNAPLTIDGTGNVGYYTSLVLLSSAIAISYHDVTNGDLKWATISLVPEIVVTQAGALADGVGSTAFGAVAVGSSSAPLTFTITNPGTADLTALALTQDGTNTSDFLASALSGTSVAPGSVANATFTVTFTPGAFPAAARSAALHLASNLPAPLNPFDIALTGNGLSTGADTDGDGLNDLAEFQMTGAGFDWQVSQPAAVSAVFGNLASAQANVNAAGYFSTAQVQALHVGTPLLEKSGGTFKLTLRLKKSATLSPPNFQPFAFTEVGTVINGQGEIEFEFTVPGDAAFFRIEAQ